MAFDSHVLQSVITKLHLNNISNGWAEARIKITRMILTIKLDRNWSGLNCLGEVEQAASAAPTDLHADMGPGQLVAGNVATGRTRRSVELHD